MRLIPTGRINSHKSRSAKEIIQLENGQRTVIDVFPKKTHEKMLNFTNQQGYHFTTVRMDNIKNIRHNRWW